MSSFISANSGWAVEISLDVEWAHAIAPQATILLVEAKSSSLTDLLAASHMLQAIRIL
jgi:subtilase family serine protease